MDRQKKSDGVEEIVVEEGYFAIATDGSIRIQGDKWYAVDGDMSAMGRYRKIPEELLKYFGEELRKQLFYFVRGNNKEAQYE